MCRADVAVTAQPALAQLLVDMGRALCEREGLDDDDIRIGPVDFGPEPTPECEACPR